MKILLNREMVDLVRATVPQVVLPGRRPPARPPSRARGHLPAAERWGVGVMTASGEQPRRQVVRVPHLAGSLLVATPGGGRERGSQLNHPSCHA
ncbi:MAG: hypothetical protein M3Z83_03965, partial [Actinomycetota bacterium]|nr:hypothetical protein [Actinomycetota bacterium]